MSHVRREIWREKRPRAQWYLVVVGTGPTRGAISRASAHKVVHADVEPKGGHLMCVKSKLRNWVLGPYLLARVELCPI